MQLPFSFFLGLRYFKPKRTFLSIITLMSVTGVTLGIMLLVVVIAVMRGFDSELKKKITGFEPHLVISSPDLLDNWREVIEIVKKHPEVTGVSPGMAGPVIAQVDNFRMAPKIRGVNLEMDEAITHLSKHIVAGEARLDGDVAIVGEELAKNLGVWVGDRITLYSPGSINELFEQFQKAEETEDKGKALSELKELVIPSEVEVVGIFNSGRYPIDSEFLMVPLFLGQELYSLGDAVQTIGISIKDPYAAQGVAEEIAAQLPDPLYIRTWIDTNQYFFDAVKMERNVIFFLLLFVVLVAAFSITNTLITVTVLKTREIGILKAVGARVSQIVWVFLSQGMIVGLIGNVVGVGVGLTVLHYRNPFKDWLARTAGLEIFPAKVYQFSQLPADLVSSDLILISSISFVICSLAALFPALVAANLDPVKALRYE